MNRAARIALWAAPFVVAGAGVIAAQMLARAPAGQRCDVPTMRVSLEGDAFVATPAEKQSALRCGEESCFVDGPETVELRRGDEVRCIYIEAGSSVYFRPSAHSSVGGIRVERTQ